MHSNYGTLTIPNCGNLTVPNPSLAPRRQINKMTIFIIIVLRTLIEVYDIVKSKLIHMSFRIRERRREVRKPVP